MSDREWLEAINTKLDAVLHAADRLTAGVYIVAMILAFIAVFLAVNAP